MKKGIVIYAHNNRTIDYALMAVISGGLAKKHLNVPVSLVTDRTTMQWMIESEIMQQAESVFENIIEVNKPVTGNQRFLHDGATGSMVPFNNTNRNSVWELTPYDRTLLIDSDYLIFSDNLSKYWDIDSHVMIGESINDIYDQKRLGYLDSYVSETGVKLYWATTVMFSKNSYSKMFFNTVNYVKENYQYFSDVFRFDSRQYRNDIAFSVAKHILDGYEETEVGRLPSVLSTLDRDILYDVDDSKLKFLINYRLDNNYCAASISGMDVHIMNKQSITRNSQKLLELI